jgi:hypothetical protein
MITQCLIHFDGEELSSTYSHFFLQSFWEDNTAQDVENRKRCRSFAFYPSLLILSFFMTSSILLFIENYKTKLRETIRQEIIDQFLQGEGVDRDLEKLQEFLKREFAALQNGELEMVTQKLQKLHIKSALGLAGSLILLVWLFSDNQGTKYKLQRAQSELRELQQLREDNEALGGFIINVIRPVFLGGEN